MSTGKVRRWGWSGALLFAGLAVLGLALIERNDDSAHAALRKHSYRNGTTHWGPIGNPKVPSVPAMYKPQTEVDNFIIVQWKDASARPANLADNYDFCRRVFLDVIGRIPDHVEMIKFLSDKDRKNRRKKLIDVLLNSPEYARHWSKWWGDLLRVHTSQNRTKPNAWRDWITKALDTNMPYDKFVAEMIAGTGGTEDNGAVQYILRDNANANELTIATSQIFLGTSLKCAQCHDHPYEQWTQQDFKEMAEFFRDVKIQRYDEAKRKALMSGKMMRGKGKMAGKGKMDSGPRGAMSKFFSSGSCCDKAKKAGRTCSHGCCKNASAKSTVCEKCNRGAAKRMAGANGKMAGKGGESMMKKKMTADEIRRMSELDYYKVFDGGRGGSPRFITGERGRAGKGKSRRAALAELMTSDKNPLLARVYVNRVWDKLLGKGLIDPVDDFSEGNDPSHPDLLDWLARRFINKKYDMKDILRVILNSKVYQLSSRPGKPTLDSDPDNDYFTRARLRRLNAEQLYDSILWATGYGGRESNKRAYAGYILQKGSWHARDPAPAGSFLFTFGSHNRDIIYERKNQPSITQMLTLMNGTMTNESGMRWKPGSPLAQLRKASGALFARNVFLQTLNRLPKGSEASWAGRYRGKIADLMWALTNSWEFQFIR